VQGYPPVSSFNPSFRPSAGFSRFQPHPPLPISSFQFSENMMTPTSSSESLDFSRAPSNDREVRSTETSSSSTSSRKTSINTIAENLIAQKMRISSSSSRSRVQDEVEVEEAVHGKFEEFTEKDQEEKSVDDKATKESSSERLSSPTQSDASLKRHHDLIDLNTTSRMMTAKKPRVSREDEQPMVELAPIPELKQRANQDENRYPLRPLIISTPVERRLNQDIHANRAFDFSNQNRMQPTNRWQNTFQSANHRRESSLMTRNQIVEAAEEMSRWSVFQVGLFLDMIGCGMYKDIFDRHCINGDSLPFLQLGNLLALGLPIGHAHTIIARVHLRLGTYPEVLKAIHGNEI